MKIASYEDMVQCFSDTFKEYHGVRPLYIRPRSYQELGKEIEQLRAWHRNVPMRMQVSMLVWLLVHLTSTLQCVGLKMPMSTVCGLK